jgi:hypothetical protein
MALWTFNFGQTLEISFTKRVKISTYFLHKSFRLVVCICCSRINNNNNNCGLPCFCISTGRKLRPSLGPTQPPIQCVLGVKRPGGEADRSPHLLVPRSRMRGAIPLPPIRLFSVVLSEAQGQRYCYQV